MRVQQVLLIALLVLAGCAGSRSTLTGPVDTRVPDSESWRRHLLALNTSDMEGRQTATRGAARAAIYIAESFRSSGLQPVRESEYRWLYPLRQYRVMKSHLFLAALDTTRFIVGTGYVVDGRSGSGEWIGELVSGDRPIDVIHEGIRVHTTQIEARPVSRTSGPVQVGLLSPALARMGTPVQSAARLHVGVVTEEMLVSGIHVAGFLPGSDPRGRDSLIVVVAQMDGFGVQGSESWTNGTDAGVDVATLLEVARTLAERQNLDRSVPFSVLFVALSGVEEECQGPAWMEQHVPWERDAILKTVVVGSMDSCLRDVHIAAAPLGWWSAGVSVPEGTFNLERRSNLLNRERTNAAEIESVGWVNTVIEVILN